MRGKVSTEQGKAEADKYGVKFFETSAKLNTNISEAFSSIAKDIVDNVKENPDRYGSGNDGGTRKAKSSAGAASLSTGARKDNSNCC